MISLSQQCWPERSLIDDRKLFGQKHLNCPKMSQWIFCNFVHKIQTTLENLSRYTWCKTYVRELNNMLFCRTQELQPGLKSTKHTHPLLHWPITSVHTNLWAAWQRTFIPLDSLVEETLCLRVLHGSYSLSYLFTKCVWINGNVKEYSDILGSMPTGFLSVINVWCTLQDFYKGRKPETKWLILN